MLLQLTKSIYDKLNCYLRSAHQSIIKRPFQQSHNYCINQTSTQDRDRPQETVGGRVLSFIPSVIILLWWWPRQLVFFAQLVGWWVGGDWCLINESTTTATTTSVNTQLSLARRQAACPGGVMLTTCLTAYRKEMGNRLVDMYERQKWQHGYRFISYIIIAKNILYNYCHVIIKRWSHAHRSLREAACSGWRRVASNLLITYWTTSTCSSFRYS